MSTTTIAQLNAAFKTILDGLTGSGQVLSVCYSWPNPMPASFPAAYPIWTESGEDTLDTKDNESAIQFILRVLIRDTNDQTSYDTAIAVADALFAELRKDDHYTLGGLCTRLHVSPSTKPLRTGEGTEALIVLDMTVTCYCLQDTTI